MSTLGGAPAATCCSGVGKHRGVTERGISTRGGRAEKLEAPNPTSTRLPPENLRRVPGAQIGGVATVAACRAVGCCVSDSPAGALPVARPSRVCLPPSRCCPVAGCHTTHTDTHSAFRSLNEPEEHRCKRPRLSSFAGSLQSRVSVTPWPSRHE
ncbi:unnamed protein product [Pleuronectes platessa]|uniref:Uncharacterized protein n=1 Tax=Pleuronectes platessa TaxID=8262 RepID=A0A9N7YAG2_PLEPL|nr:unnamed protein product [Pleuronectes platessa]